MSLHRITGRATKCGPSALSAILGIPTHEAARSIREATGRKSVNGTSFFELYHALRKHGRKLAHMIIRDEAPEWTRMPHGATPTVEKQRVTLGSFLDTAPAGTWIIAVSTHWIAYADGMVADSGFLFSRKPRPWSECKYHRRRRIQMAARIDIAKPARRVKRDPIWELLLQRDAERNRIAAA